MINEEEYEKGYRCTGVFTNNKLCLACEDKQSCYQYNTTPFLNDSVKINQIHNKVYLLTYDIGNAIHGIFSTREKAMQYIKDMNSSYLDGWSIKEWEIDKGVNN